MILSDRDIKLEVERCNIISPILASQIQPASVDVRLGNEFLFVKTDEPLIHPRFPVEHEKILENYHFVIKPQQFVLATTIEKLNLPDDIAAFVEGRSSWGRLGLFIHNAGWVDPGFKGTITLELFNANSVPIVLSPEEKIAQIVFARMSSPAEHPYNGKYQGQIGTTESKYYEEGKQK